MEPFIFSVGLIVGVILTLVSLLSIENGDDDDDNEI